MTRMGIRVPPGFAITTYAYEFFMKRTGLERAVFPMAQKTRDAGKDGLPEICREIRELIISQELPEEVLLEIGDAYGELCRASGREDLPVAVRSSATAEDLPWASFAGLQDTYLWISGLDSVVEHVKRCWASLFSDRAVSYRNDMGFSHEREKISVAVQKMVDAKCAGVMFTLNPLSGYMGEVVINSSWGLGEAVERLVSMARRYGVPRVRLSGGEPTIGFDHLVEVIEGVTGEGLEFILETNGVLIGAREELARRLAGFHGSGLEVRVSIKGTSPEEFHMLTKARPEAWRLQLRALELLVAYGLEPGEEVYPAVMLSFTDERGARRILGELARIHPRLARSIDPEYVILYPHVRRLMARTGLKPRVAYTPDGLPAELV